MCCRTYACQSIQLEGMERGRKEGREREDISEVKHAVQCVCWSRSLSPSPEYHHTAQLNTLQLSELVRHDPQLSISEILSPEGRRGDEGTADGDTNRYSGGGTVRMTTHCHGNHQQCTQHDKYYGSWWTDVSVCLYTCVCMSQLITS